MQALADKFQNLLGIPEWILLQEVKLGDKEAFSKLYQLYLDKIYRYVFFRVNQQKELAEDITADIFLKAWEKIDTFQNESFQAWLYAIARNTIIDHFRVAKYHAQLDDHIADEKQEIEEGLYIQMEMEKVKGALDKLTPEQQELIVLKFIEQLSNKEIGQILGKKEEAIRSLQYRAIKELKKIMK